MARKAFSTPPGWPRGQKLSQCSLRCAFFRNGSVSSPTPMPAYAFSPCFSEARSPSSLSAKALTLPDLRGGSLAQFADPFSIGTKVAKTDPADRAEVNFLLSDPCHNIISKSEPESFGHAFDPARFEVGTNIHKAHIPHRRRDRSGGIGLARSPEWKGRKVGIRIVDDLR